jgi:hypothetical protein
MIEELKTSDIDVILESLRYSKQRIEDYREQPSSAFKRQQVERFEKVIVKVRAARNHVAR